MRSTQVSKPSLRAYSSIGKDFQKLSQVVQNDSDIPTNIKQEFQIISNAYDKASQKALDNRTPPFGEAHAAWQKDHAGPFVDATSRAKKFLEYPKIKQAVKNIVTGAGKSINSQVLLEDINSIIKSEKFGVVRNPGFHADHANPLLIKAKTPEPA